MKIIIIYKPFPEGMHGIIAGGVQRYEKGYLILIDCELTAEEQAFTLRHEFAHIMLNHCDTGTGVFGEGWEQREKEADDYADKMTDSLLDALLSLSEVIHEEK